MLTWCWKHLRATKSCVILRNREDHSWKNQARGESNFDVERACTPNPLHPICEQDSKKMFPLDRRNDEPKRLLLSRAVRSVHQTRRSEIRGPLPECSFENLPDLPFEDVQEFCVFHRSPKRVACLLLNLCRAN